MINRKNVTLIPARNAVAGMNLFYRNNNTKINVTCNFLYFLLYEKEIYYYLK